MSEDVLQQARHGMSVLWDEVQSLRSRLVESATGDFEKHASRLREDFKSIVHKLEHLMSIHDDIATVLADVETKLDTLIAAKADGDAANSDLLTAAKSLQSKVTSAVSALTGSVVATVTAATPAGATTLPVSIPATPSPIPAGSTVEGDSVAPSTTTASTVSAMSSSITLSTPTTDSHDVGDKVTITPAAS